MNSYSYSISELATSYFFSNLLEMINNTSIELQAITDSMYEHLFPISEGKEKHKRWTLKLDGSLAAIHWKLEEYIYEEQSKKIIHYK